MVYADGWMATAGWTTWIAIGVGSAVGGVARQLLTDAATRLAGSAFPWGTVAVNLSGSLAIGVIAALLANAAPTGWTALARPALMTGLLGGFTTFSAFSLQTVTLLQQGLWPAAAANVLSSVVLGVAACWIGFAVVSALR